MSLRALFACLVAAGIALVPVHVPAAQGIDVRELMLARVVPASDAVFNAAATPPEREEEWSALKTAVAQLSDSGRILLKDTRATEGAEWNAFSNELIAAAARALSAADKRDADLLAAAGDALYATCEGCHRKYLPKPTEAKPLSL